MAGNIRGITVEVEFRGETVKLQKAVSTLNRDIKSSQKYVNALNRQLKLDPTNTTLLSKKFELLKNNVKLAKEKVDTLNQSIAKLKASKTFREEDLNDYNAQLALAKTRLAEAQDALNKFGSVNQAAFRGLGEQIAEEGEKVYELGQKLMVVTIALGAIGAASILAAAKFESSFAGVEKTVDATTKQFEELKNQSREIALTKPIDVNDVNLIMELGGQLGIAAENLSEFADVISDLDVATNLNVESASEQIARFANITGLAADEYSNFGSALVELGNNAATTEADIMNMSMRLASAGTIVGMTEDEILALATATSSVGIEAEMGGTAVSRMLMQISKDVGNNTETLEVWASTAGMTAEQFTQAWETNPTQALQALFAGLADIQDEGSAVYSLLDELGISSIRQTDTMMRLGLASEKLSGYIGMSSEAWDENVALTREAERRYATTESQIQILKNHVNDLGISIGDKLVPVFRGFVDVAVATVDGVKSLVEGFSELPAPIQYGTGAFLAFATAAAPMMMISGKLVQGFGLLTIALSKYGASLASKAAAQGVDIAMTTASVGATKKQTMANALNEIMTLSVAMANKQKTAATAADTLVTQASTAATKGGTVATIAHTIATNASAVATRGMAVAQAALNIAWKANPVGLVVAGVTAFAAAMIALGYAMKTSIEEQNRYNGLTEKQNEQLEELTGYTLELTKSEAEYTNATRENVSALQDLMTEYDNLEDKEGKNAQRARELQYEMQTLAHEIQYGTQTMEEFCEVLDKTVDDSNAMQDTLRQNIMEAEVSAGRVENLGNELQVLGEKFANGEATADEFNTALSNFNSATGGNIELIDTETMSLKQQNAAMEKACKLAERRSELKQREIMYTAQTEAATQAEEEHLTVMAQREAAESELAAARENLNKAEQDALRSQRNTGRKYKADTAEMKEYREQVTSLEEDVANLTEEEKEWKATAEATAAAVARLQTEEAAFADAKEKLTGTWKSQEEAQKAVIDAYSEYYAACINAGYTQGEIMTAVEFTNAILADQELVIQENVNALKTFATETPGFLTAIESMEGGAEGLARVLSSTGTAVDDYTKTFGEMASEVGSYNTKIENDAEMTAAKMTEVWDHNTKQVETYSNNYSALVSKYGKEGNEEFLNYLSTLGPESAKFLGELKNEDTWNEVKESWEANQQAVGDATLTALGIVQKDIDEAMAGMTESVTNGSKDTGKNFTLGFIASVDVEEFNAKGKTAGEEAIAGLNEGAGCHSPSVKAKETGKNVGLGFILGIQEKGPEIQTVFKNTVSNALKGGNATNQGRNLGVKIMSSVANGLAQSRVKVTNGVTVAITAASNIARNIAVNGFRNAGNLAGQGFNSAITPRIKAASTNVQRIIASMCRTAANSGKSGMRTAAAAAADAYASSLKSGMDKAKSGVNTAIRNAGESARATGHTAFYSAGWWAGQGLIDGLNSRRQGILNTAESIARAAANKINDELEINSPSRVTRRSGVGIGEGLEYGMRDKMPDVENMAGVLAEAAVPDFGQLESRITTTFGGESMVSALQAASTRQTESIGKRLDALAAIAKKGLENGNRQIVLDTGVVAGALTPSIDKNLQRRAATKGGGF